MWRVKFSTPRKIGCSVRSPQQGHKTAPIGSSPVTGKGTGDRAAEPRARKRAESVPRARRPCAWPGGAFSRRRRRFLSSAAAGISSASPFPAAGSFAEAKRPARLGLRARGCSGARRCLRATDQDLAGRPSAGSSLKQTMVRSPAASEVSRARRLARRQK